MEVYANGGDFPLPSPASILSPMGFVIGGSVFLVLNARNKNGMKSRGSPREN